MNYRGKNITVLGMARSGIASAKKLASLGAKVLLSEAKPAEQIDPNLIETLKAAGVNLELGGHTDQTIESADMIVVSPGIHLDIPILEQAKQKKIPIISEIELAYQILKKPMIALTGTNGKTTTTTLLGEMLKAGGKKVAVAGNIGNPLIEVAETNLDYIVAEISSYQLEATKEFKPWISVVLNIQEDHLERHHSMAEYIKQKSRIFINQTSDDYLVYNGDEVIVKEMVTKAKAKLVSFKKSDKTIITLDPAEIKIPGEHNLENALAAAQVAYLCGIEKETVNQVLKTFPGVEHRIEFVRSIKGIDFYNDSKATNPDSTIVALKTFSDNKVIVILGGKDKGVTLNKMIELIKQKAKAVVLLGEASQRFEKALKDSGYNNLYRSNSLSDAVSKIIELGEDGDIGLLSPACASFDMFKNYEERGKIFKQAVING